MKLMDGMIKNVTVTTKVLIDHFQLLSTNNHHHRLLGLLLLSLKRLLNDQIDYKITRLSRIVAMYTGCV